MSITLPDDRSISDGFDPSMTQQDLLFLARIHCTYDHHYPQWENLINQRPVDVNALFYEINIRLGYIRELVRFGSMTEEYGWRCTNEWCAMKDFIGTHPELYPTTSYRAATLFRAVE